MVRTTLGAEVETTVTVSGSESVDFLEIEPTTDIPTGQDERIVIRPPSGALYELIAATLLASSPGGNSTDTHQLTIQSEQKFIALLNIVSSGDKRILFASNVVQDGDVTQTPGSDAAQTVAVRGARAGRQDGFTIRYLNRSGATQTNSRRYRLWVREIEVGE
jgi:hypothetical protein